MAGAGTTVIIMDAGSSGHKDPLEEAEQRVQQALYRAAAAREQLELAEHDKRALVAQAERLEAAERAARLHSANVETLRENDRKEHLKLKAQLVEANASLRASQLKIDTLTTSLGSTEGEIKWFSSELERRSAVSREKAWKYSSQMEELENSLQTQLAENEALKRQLNKSRASEKMALEQLERKQVPAAAPQQSMDISWQDLTVLEAELQISRMQQDTSNKRHNDITEAYADALARESQLSKRVSEVEQSLKRAQDSLHSKSGEFDLVAAASGRLGRLLKHILINSQLSSDGLPLLTAQEKLDLDNALKAPLGVSDTMQVLEDRLVYFVDVSELVDMNQKQLRVLDTLAAKCEKYEAADEEESDTIKAATQHIENLTAANEKLEHELKLLRESQIQLNQPKEHNEHKVSTPEPDVDSGLTTPPHISEYQLRSLKNELEAAQELCSTLRSSEMLAKTQKEALSSQLQSQSRDLVQASARADFSAQENDTLRSRLSEKDELFSATQRQNLAEIESLRTQVTLHRHENLELQQQNKLRIQQLEAGRRDYEAVNAKLVEARHSGEKLQFRLDALQKEVEEGAERLRLRTISFTTADTERVHALEQELEQAQGQIKDLRALAAENQKLLEAKDKALAQATAEAADKQQQFDKALSEAKSAFETLKNTPPDTTELDATKTQLAAKAKELEVANQKIQSVEAEAVSKAAELAKSLANAKSDADAQASALVAQVKQLQTDLANAAASSSQLASTSAELQALKSSNKVLDELTSNLRIENTQLSAKNEQLLAAQADPETSEVTEMLKRDKQKAVLELQEALDKAKMLELKLQALQSLNTEEPNNEAAPMDTVLLEANENLGKEIRQLGQQMETLEQELVVAKSSLSPLQESLRTAETARDGFKAQLDLAIKDRDVWKQHSEGSSELTSLQEQLTAATTKVEQLTAELEQRQQEFEKEKAALLATVDELKSDTTNKERITHLENEINRISDELTEEEQKSRGLAQELKELQERPAPVVAPAPVAVDPLPEMEPEQGHSEELEALVKEFGEADAPKVQRLRELTTNDVKNRLRQKTQAVIHSQIAKAAEEERAKALKQISDEKDSVELGIKKKYELKSKIMQQKIEKLTETNEELKLTVRKLKGGEQVSIVTMPDGTTKAVPKAQPQQQQQQQQPQQQGQNHNQNQKQQQKQQKIQRPAINRNGKRKNDNDDTITKRMRDS